MKYTQAINIIRKCQFDIIDLMASNLIKSKVLKYDKVQYLLMTSKQGPPGE